MKRALFAVIISLLAPACGAKQPTQSQAVEPLVEKPEAPQPPPEDPFRCDDTTTPAWPMFQQDAGRRGRSEASPIRKPSVAWSAQIGIASWLNNPIVAAGRVFAPSSGQVWNQPDGSDGVYAFDLASGEQIWFASSSNDANGIAYRRCRVFVTTDGGEVSALDARTGEQLWTRTFDGKLYSNPLALDDLVVVGGSSGLLAALDARSGETRWEHEVGASIRGGAAADDDQVYVVTEAGRLAAFSRKDGALAWLVELQAEGLQGAYAAPTVDDDKVYVSFVRDTSYAVPAIKMFDTATGQQRWQATNSRQLSGGWGNIRSSPALHDGRLYWGESYSNRLIGLDAAGGDVAVSHPVGPCMFPQWASPALAQDVVYLPRHDGGLYAFDLTENALAWSLYLGDAKSASQSFPPEHLERDSDACQWEPPFGRPLFASPALAGDGTLIIATGDGWLHAVREAE